MYRIDGAGGRREVWKEFTPADATGLKSIWPGAISADGKTVVFACRTHLSTLHLGEGIR